MKRLRGVVVGTGAITRSMARQLEPLPWFEAAAVVDPRAEAREAATGWLPGATAHADLESALRDANGLEVAIVNTPSHLHAEQVRVLLEAGLHVLVAKPMTNDFDDAVGLVELAERSGRTLCVGQQMRYVRHYQAVAKAVRGGLVGEVESVAFLNAKPRPEPGNLHDLDHPALYEMSCHHFDSLAAVLPGRVPLSISCRAFSPSWSRYAGASMANALIELSGGVQVLYQGGFSSQAPQYELRLEGTRGALRSRGVHMSVDAMTNEIAPPGGDFAPADIDAGIPVVDPWQPFLARWGDYLAGGPEPAFSGRRNLEVFALLSAAIESAGEGGAVVPVRTNPRYAAAFGPLHTGEVEAAR